jgi:uncharacterized linocin/CFP29 family protein
VFHSVEIATCCTDEDASVLKLAEEISWADAIANTGVVTERASDFELFVAMCVNIEGGLLWSTA